jgi:hypothetical protein
MGITIALELSLARPANRGRGVASLHTLFPLPCRLRRIFRPIVETAMLPMFHVWQYLALRGSVAPKLIGDGPRGAYVKPFRSLRKNSLAVFCRANVRREYLGYSPPAPRPVRDRGVRR